MESSFANGYALLVGVGEARHTPWSLPVTASDARRLKKVLVDPDRCAYPDDTDRVRLLLDDDASAANILEALDLLARSASANPAATVLIYYSGHGWLQDDGRYYLIPSDTRPEDVPGSAVSAKRFMEKLRKIRSSRVLIILDTCHAGGMASAKSVPMPAVPKGFAQKALPEELLEVLNTGRGRVVLTSCRQDQKSWIFPDRGLSVFTYHLLEAFEGAGNRDGEKIVKLSNLMNHVGEQVSASARGLGQVQTPFFKLEAEDFAVACVGSDSEESSKSGLRRQIVRSKSKDPSRGLLGLEELRGVRDSWRLLDEIVGGAGSGRDHRASSATVRQILGALSQAANKPEMEEALHSAMAGFREQGKSVLEPECLARLYLTMGGSLSVAGHFAASFQAFRICRRIVETSRAQDPMTDGLLAVYDELTNREAVAMRDDFQTSLALEHLSEFGIPKGRPLLYEGVCVLGTKAQLLTYAAENQRTENRTDTSVADELLSEAQSLLHYAIAFLEKTPEHRAELPREHNYLGSVLGVRGNLDEMSAALETALEINDRQFQAAGCKQELCHVWIENALYSFQLWLRFCDLAPDVERFRHVDQLYRERRRKIIAETADSEAILSFESRYPAVLVRRYRARTWARRLKGLSAPELWSERVVEPLLELEALFRQKTSMQDLAAAMLVDLLLLASSDELRITEWVGRLIELLRDVAASSRERWRGHEYDVKKVYREPFKTELSQLEAFREGRLPMLDLLPSLESLRAQLGY